MVWLALLAAFGKVPKKYREAVDASVKVGNVAKEVLHNPALDFGVALTATALDDKILALVRKGVTIFVAAANAADEILDAKTDAELQAALRKAYFALPENLRSAFIAKLASFLARFISKEQLDLALSEVKADTLVQIAYARSKNEA